MDAYFTAAALLVVAIIYALDKFNMLPKRRSSSDAAAELLIKDQTIERIRRERNEARQHAADLEATRSLSPVLDQLERGAQLQTEIVDRLASHNGSFMHMETSLREIAEGFKLMTGFIAGALGVHTDDPPG